MLLISRLINRSGLRIFHSKVFSSVQINHCAWLVNIAFFQLEPEGSFEAKIVEGSKGIQFGLFYIS